MHSDKRTVAAYVRFKTRGEAEKAAAEARGLMINDNHLIVDLVIKFKSDKRDNKKAIFVGNLNLSMPYTPNLIIYLTYLFVRFSHITFLLAVAFFPFQN